MIHIHTQLAHHYLTQPRDWHGRWCANEGCGAVDPKADGVPQRCYHSPVLGDPGQYIDLLGQLLTGDLSCQDIDDLYDEAQRQFGELLAAASQLEEAARSMQLREDLLTIGAAVVGGALAALLATATGGLSIGFSALLVVSELTQVAVTLLGASIAANIFDQLDPDVAASIPPDQLAEQFSTLFTEAYQALQAGENLAETVLNQVSSLDIPGIPTEQLQHTYMAAMISLLRSQARYLNNTLIPTYIKLQNDCADLEKFRAELERYHAKLKARYDQECTGG